MFQYPILYLRQYSDPELRGCDALGDSKEEQLVKAVYKNIDRMSDNLERGHEVLFQNSEEPTPLSMTHSTEDGIKPSE
jgi:hypothetical protein